jgi:hypothetical protein
MILRPGMEMVKVVEDDQIGSKNPDTPRSGLFNAMMLEGWRPIGPCQSKDTIRWKPMGLMIIPEYQVEIIACYTTIQVRKYKKYSPDTHTVQKVYIIVVRWCLK